MSAQGWLDRTQRIADAATEGPWFLSPHEDDPVWGAVVTGGVDENDNDQEPCIEAGTRTDARFIAHARTAVPQAVAALRAVTDLHQPRSTVAQSGSGHIVDTPGPCTACDWDWPCPTVKAITETLAGDSHTPV